MAVGITTVAFCQKTFILSHQDKKGFFAVSAGVSLPVGKFASCSSEDNQACMAGKGLAFNLSAGYRIVGPVGLMIRGEQHRNAVQTSALLTELYRNETDVWTAKADNWSVSTLMAGPYFSMPIGGLFSVDARLLAGRASAVLPNTSMAGNFGQKEIAVNTTGSQSMAMVYGGGATLRYRLGRIMSLHLNADYSRASFVFDNLTSTAVSTDKRSESSTYSSERIISMVSVSAGVAILFSTKYHPF